jgi:hypothetical protein
MIRTLLIAAAPTVALALASTSFAQQSGGAAAQAKTMLENAVAAVKANKSKAIDMFNKGQNGFLEGDLYVFCDSLADGKIIAMGNPNTKYLLGKDARALMDASGKPYGREILDGQRKPEGQITEVRYLFPKPGADDTPVPKVSLVTKAGDLGCGVGYYLQ